MNQLFGIVLALSSLSSAAFGACIASGTEANINAALTGTGSSAVLCPNAVFNLSNPVVFTAPNQQLYTEGLPTDSSRAILRVTGSTQTNAINGYQNGITIENIQVDGNRPALGFLSGLALIDIGGNSMNQTVKNNYIHDPRSWSALHIVEGQVTNSIPACQTATISDNQIGPSGTSDSGHWADGISLACGNSIVENNRITDATDGAIVIFGAPGSTIQNNTITAASRNLLGGINMVDYAPMSGNFSGVLVQHNTINAQGALIKVGIAMGPAVWNCDTRINHGATVTENMIEGANFGYGYPVNGVTNWTVSNNTDIARHIGLVSAGCGGTPSQPAGFQSQVATSSSLQAQYVPGSLSFVLGLSEPSILTVVRQPAACTTMRANEGLLPGQTELSCDGRFALTLLTNGNLVLTEGSTQLFSTNTAGKNVAQAIMQGDGNFVLYDVSGKGIWATGTAGQPGAFIDVQDDGNLVIYGNSGPIWDSGTCCH